MSIYHKLENSNTERDNLTVLKKTAYDPTEISESVMLDDEYISQNKRQLKNEFKEKAYEYYKIHGNLNEFMYSTDNPEIRKKFEKWMKSFYNRSMIDKKTSASSKINFEEEKIIDEMNITGNTTNFLSKVRLSRKTKNLLAVSKSKVFIPEKKNRFNDEFSDIYKKMYPEYTNERKNVNEFMDLDESVEVELPNDFNDTKDDQLLADVAEKIIIIRDSIMKKEGVDNDCNSNSNDEFCLFLNLLKKKKMFYKEKIPFYIDYNVKKYLHRNEKEEAGLKEETEVDDAFIDNFISDFIEN